MSYWAVITTGCPRSIAAQHGRPILHSEPSLLTAVAALLLFGGCQSVPTAGNPKHRPLSHQIGIAHGAWLALQGSSPDSPATTKSMVRYNRAVEQVVQGLEQYRGANWARPIALDSSRTLRFGVGDDAGGASVTG